MLAIGLASPELMLSEPECEALAKAIANVGKYYVAVKTSNKLAAWGALFMTLGIVYGPRIMAMRRKQAAQEHASQQGPQ